jgi:HD superfamily phosphodiesterase
VTLTAAEADWAASEAARLMQPVGARWRHVLGVVMAAERVEAALPESERFWLVAAAYLHDIGYATQLAVAGCHAIDGAVWLRTRGRERLAVLVAHHSGARFEASARGLGAEIAAFEREESPTADALTYCDLTTDAAGAPVSAVQRIADIERRYGAGHVVQVAIRRATPSLLDAVWRTRLRLAGPYVTAGSGRSSR